MATNPRQAERETSETARKAADRTEQTSRTISNAAERTAHAASDAFRHNAESFSNTWGDSSEAASRIAERSMDQFSKLFGFSGESTRQTMQQSATGVQALIDSSTVLAAGLQTFSEEWMRFVQDRVQENLECFEELLACRTPQDCMTLQARIVRDNVEALLQSARRMSELSTKLTDDTVKRMSDVALAPR